MSDFLITNTEVHKVDTEEEALALITEYKRKFTLTGYKCEAKKAKVNGEEQEFYKVTLSISWNDIKEPMTPIKVTYEAEF